MRLAVAPLLVACLLNVADIRAQGAASASAANDATAAVARWLATQAIPLRTVRADRDFDDLQPLRDVIGDARIVLLGEPTHGNREVYQVKHRLVEFLVREMGFSVVALETPMPESFDVDAYVSRGIGTPSRALAAAHVWPWDTEEAAATDADAWAVARQHAQVLQRWMEANAADGRRYNEVRDSSMAENIKWIRNREGPDAKVIVWAHNTHVANWRFPHAAGPFAVAGHHLRLWYGDDVVILGALFGRGSFSALEVGSDSRGVWTFDAGAPPAGSIESAFAAAGLSLAVVDLRRLPAAGPVAAWFGQPRLTRHNGGAFEAANPRRHAMAYPAPVAFDALVYVDSSTPTRLMEPADRGTCPVLSAPVNLGFEHGVVGEAPSGWLAWSKLRRFGVEIATTDEDAHSGRRSAVVRRAAADVVGEASGSVLQRIDATEYRGRRVRLRAAVRAELGEGSLAFLRLRIQPDEFMDHGVPGPTFDSLDDFRVSSTSWRFLEIEAEVPDDAAIISYGLFLAGSGAAWMDDVSFELVGDASDRAR